MTEIRHFVSRVYDGFNVYNGSNGSVAFSLAHSQRGLWIAQNLASHVPFNIAQYVELRGALKIDLLIAATDRASRELSSPLLRIVDRGGEPFQVVDNTIDDALQYRDLRGHGDPVAVAHEWMIECYSRPLDLCADRLIEPCSYTSVRPTTFGSATPTTWCSTGTARWF